MRVTALLLGSFVLAACSHSTPAQPSGEGGRTSTGAAKLCSSAFGTHYLNSATGSVADVRTLAVGPGYRPGRDAFVGMAGSHTMAWCWTGAPGAYTLYAVVQGHPPFRMEGLGGTLELQAPAPGPAPIP